MNVIISKFPLAVIALLLFSSCSLEEKEGLTIEGNLSTQDSLLLAPELQNSIWLLEGGNCNTYFDFGINTFILSNPCFSNGVVDNVSWHSGYCGTSANILTRIVGDACQASLIGNRYTGQYEVEQDTLLFIFESDTVALVRIDAVPEFPEDTRFGYWDFGNGNGWMTVPACTSPY